MLTPSNAFAIVDSIIRSGTGPFAGLVRMRRERDVLEVSATDGPRSALARATSVGPDLDVVVAGDKARKAIAAFGDDCDIKTTAARLTVSGRSGKMAIGISDAKIDISHKAVDDAVKVSGEAFRASLARVFPFADVGYTRAHTYGINVEARGRMVGASNAGLAYCRAPDGVAVFLPAPIIGPALEMKSDAIRVFGNDSFVTIEDDDVSIRCSAVSANFVPYEQVIGGKAAPKNWATANRTAIIEAIKVCGLASESGAVEVVPGKSVTLKSVGSGGAAESSSVVVVDGKLPHTAFGIDLLLKAIRFARGDEIRIGWTDAENPFHVRGSDDAEGQDLAIVMPRKP